MSFTQRSSYLLQSWNFFAFFFMLQRRLLIPQNHSKLPRYFILPFKLLCIRPSLHPWMLNRTPYSFLCKWGSFLNNTHLPKTHLKAFTYSKAPAGVGNVCIWKSTMVRNVLPLSFRMLKKVKIIYLGFRNTASPI